MTSIFLAYSALFIAIFVFSWSMFSRQKRLNEKLNELREELKDVSRK